MLDRVSPGYFETIGTPLVLGRAFDDRDAPGAPLVAVVNQEFVHQYFSDSSPIGRRFGIGGPAHAGDLEIVGVVADAKYDNPRTAVRPMAFFPMLQMRTTTPDADDLESLFANTIQIRTSSDSGAMAAEVRRALAEIDPRIAVMRVSTLTANVGSTLNQENTVAALAAFFAFVALLLSCLGLYGLMAYAVQRRTSELGIRIALGARRATVISMVIREAMFQGLCGILIGIPAAFGAVRLIANQLYGVSPADPEYAVGAAAVLLLCITVSAYIPALRAARVDPIRALKYE